MILQFIVEPELLKDVADRGNWTTFVDSLERFWPSHGVLIMPPDFENTFNQSGLDSHRLSEWKKFVTHDAHRKSHLTTEFAGFTWARLESWDDLDRYDSHIDLALLQDVRAALFGLVEDDIPCVHDPRQKVPIDIARGHHVLSACKVREVEDRAMKAVTPFESPEQVWQERFRRHAKHSTSVAVVDKFAIEDWTGLRLFLEKLVTDGWQSEVKTQTVDVYTTYQHFNGQGQGNPSSIKSKIEAEAARLSNELNFQVPNVRINVNLLHPADVPHDRWIRFDKNILELGKGLATLEANRNQAFSFQLKKEDIGRQQQEMRLKSLCRNERASGPTFLNVSSYPRRAR